MDSPIELVIVMPIGIAGLLGAAWLLIRSTPAAFKTVQDGRLSGAEARKLRAEAESVEIDNEERRDQRQTRALMYKAIRTELEREGATLDAETATSRLFNSAFDQLTDNLEGLGRERVTGLELPDFADGARLEIGSGDTGSPDADLSNLDEPPSPSSIDEE